MRVIDFSSTTAVPAGSLAIAVIAVGCGPAPIQPDVDDPAPFYEAMEIFEPIDLHVHSASVVELPNGDLFAAWFEGSGERWADHVLIKGARLQRGASAWGEPFLLADTIESPDVNPGSLHRRTRPPVAPLVHGLGKSVGDLATQVPHKQQLYDAGGASEMGLAGGTARQAR